MNPVIGSGKNLFPDAPCVEDPEVLKRILQGLAVFHDFAGNPVLPKDTAATPSVSSLRWVPFQLTTTFVSSQATANVLDLGNSATGETVSVYDPYSLWSSAAGSETGAGILTRHPTTNAQVVLVVTPLTGGGGGGSGDNDKVKISATETTADYLENQILNSDPGGDIPSHSFQVFQTSYKSSGNEGTVLYAPYYHAKVNASESSAAYLEDQLSSVAGSVNSGYTRVVFHTDADDVIWAEAEEPPSLGDSENYRLVRGRVDEASGVVAGATFKIDNIVPLAGGLDPSSGSASFELDVDSAKQAYSDNDIVVAIYDPSSGNNWVDFTEIEDAPIFECLVTYGQSLSAATWNNGTSRWTNGYGVVSLLTDNANGTLDESGGTQTVEWRPNVAVSPASGTAYRGHGLIRGTVNYSTGTVSISGTTATFAGASIPVNIGTGHTLTVGGSNYTIASRNSSTNLTLASSGSLTSQPYTISGARYVLEAIYTCEGVSYS